MAKFLKLHAISTHYDKETTATTYPISVNVNKIKTFQPDSSYRFWDKINIPDDVMPFTISGTPTLINLGYNQSILVLESYEDISKTIS